MAFANVSVVVTVVQELRGERVLEALRALSSPRALVVRGGETVRIPGADIVLGDLIVISEGDRIPADAILLDGAELEVDESLLTGESLPVQRRAATTGDRAESSSIVRSGTLAVRGQGLAQVIATGRRSEIGKIGQTLGSVDRDAPRLSQQIRKLVRVVGLVGFITCAAVVLYIGVVRGHWLKGLLAASRSAWRFCQKNSPWS